MGLVSDITLCIIMTIYLFRKPQKYSFTQSPVNKEQLASCLLFKETLIEACLLLDKRSIDCSVVFWVISELYLWYIVIL